MFSAYYDNFSNDKHCCPKYFDFFVVVQNILFFFLKSIPSDTIDAITHSSSSHDLAVTVGGTVGASVIVVIGVILAFVAIRYAF